MRIFIVNSLQQCGNKSFFCLLILFSLNIQHVSDNVEKNIADGISQQITLMLIKLDKALEIVVKDFWNSFAQF